MTFPKKYSFSNIFEILSGHREMGIFVIIIFLSINLTFISPRFLNINNLLNIGRQSSSLCIMAIGLGLVMISGNIDLSIGSIYGLASIITAIILAKTGNLLLSLSAGILVGIVIGILNGLLIIKAKLPAFIATFGMMYVARGICLIITRGYPISLPMEGVTEDTNPVFYFLGQGKLFETIPMQFVFMLIIIIIANFILDRTIFGKHILAVGSSKKAAFVSGVNTDLVILKTFIISGVVSAIAGILSLSFIASVLPIAGQGLEFTVFAGVIIGGTSMAGGEGSVLGIFLGAIILGIIKNGLVLLGVNPFWQIFIIGLITILAVSYDSLTWEYRKTKRINM